jgi:beta-glucosidase
MNLMAAEGKMKKEDLLELLSDMTLEEKIGQMVQISGQLFGSRDALITGPAGNFQISDSKKKLVGSVLGVKSAAKIKEMQDRAMRDQPHHIPMMFMLDVINGFQTVFPIDLALGCSFDPDMMERTCAVAADEASAAGVQLTFAPMADLVRDARWGRVMESTGEDPYLNSLMAAAQVRGFQGGDKTVIPRGKIASCVKHFAGYGAPEGGREYENVELSERTFRNDYLAGYKAAVDAGCRMVMTSFNTLNRVPSSANAHLLRDILRGELGFKGVVISDYAAVEELIPHGIAADRREAAKLAVLAGVDIEMMSGCYLESLADLVRNGEVSEKMIDEAVLRILSLKNELGLFENPCRDADEAAENEKILCAAHRAEAAKDIPETFVLLKNEGKMLPLSRKDHRKILFAGPYLDNHLLCGSWSFPNDVEGIPTIGSKLREYLGSDPDVSYARGCGVVPDGTQLKGNTLKDLTPEENEAAIEETCRLAEDADQVVLFLGEHVYQTGEAGSRTVLRLPEPQRELLRRVSAVNKQTAAVLITGRPLVLSEAEQAADAILIAWRPGTEGAQALVKVLFGEEEPSGRLSMSFPVTEGQVPVYYSRFQGGRPRYRKTDSTSFRLGYIDVDYRPEFSFGAGEGYTSFEYSPVVLDSDRMDADGSIEASATLRNTGSRTGTEVVQMYLRDLTGSVVRPVKELKGFRRVSLKPGEAQKISFKIEEPMLRFIRADMTCGSEPGKFRVFIGHDSTTENSAEFTLS